MEVIKALNLGLRFILEIFVLISLGFWGFKVSEGIVMKLFLGIGTPLLAAVIWGTFGAPKAPYLLEGVSFLILEIIVFGSAAVALFLIGKQNLAFIYGIIVIINITLMKIWHQ